MRGVSRFRGRAGTRRPTGEGRGGRSDPRRAGQAWVPSGGLRHLALKTTSLRLTEDFYTGVLGFERAFAQGAMIFLRSPAGDDLLNFVRVRTGFDPKAGGLDHFGLRIPPPEWVALRRRLRGARVPIRGRRGRSAVYIEDPNGYTVELYRD